MNTITKISQVLPGAGWITLVLLFASTAAFGGGAAQVEENSGLIKSIMLEIPAAGHLSIPLQIAPVLIDAPVHQINLMEGADSGQLLGGFPIYLSAYPIFNLGIKSLNSSVWGVNLELDSHATGKVDSLVHIGYPRLFPDMLDSRIDFHSAEFVPKGKIYSISRKIGLGRDEKWHFTPQGVALAGITNGVVSASFVPGGDFVLTKSFDALDIEKAPLVDYEYSLPERGKWFVQINAKVDIGGLNNDVLLFSRKFGGGGRQKLLLNLGEILRENYPHVKEAILKDLVIHFVLDPTSAEVKDGKIDLGRLDFYRVQQPAQGDMPSRILIVSSDAKPIDLMEKLELLGINGEIRVLRGSLVRFDNTVKPKELPEISVQGMYREKIPKLFVGDAEYLDDLSARELREVLDQKMFLEKDILWQVGQSKVVFLNQISSEGLDSLPLIEYVPDISVSDKSYILVNYAFGGGEQLPVYLTLSGVDRQGKWTSFDRLLTNNKPIKIDELKLKKISISYRGRNLSTLLPTSFWIQNIQVNKAKKSQVYHQKKSLAMIAFDESLHSNSLPSQAGSIWKATPENIDFGMNGNDTLQSVKSFSINRKIVGDSFVRVDISPSGTESWFLKLMGKKKDVQIEQLIPLANQCKVKLSEMELQSIDLVVKSGLNAGLGQIKINQMEIGFDKQTHENIIWSAPVMGVNVKGSAALVTAASFVVDKKITKGASLDYAIELTAGPAMSYLMRIRGRNALGTFERLIPLALQGSLYLPEMDLQLIDFVVKGGDGAITTTLQLGRLMLREAEKATQQQIHIVDASLSYAEILKGRKQIQIPLSFRDSGEHRLDYTSSNGIDINISPDSIKSSLPRESNREAKIASQSMSREVRVYFWYAGAGLAAMLLYIVGRKHMLRWLPPEKSPRLYSLGFWAIEIVLLIVGIYVAFKSGSKDAFSWGGVILLMSYAFLVRWKIRPWLKSTWPEISDRLSAPYFLLFFILLLSCALSLLFDFDSVVERIAVYAYFLLLVAVAVEFMQFAHTASNATADPS